MKRAVVFNNHMYVRGGGERSTLVFALALKKIGFEVKILSQGPVQSAADIESYFGHEFEGIETRQIVLKEKEDIYDHLNGSGIDVFVNHSHGDMSRNPAPFGENKQILAKLRL